MQIDMFPSLERFDVEFDLPDALLPEFPPGILLSNRPEFDDVSRGADADRDEVWKRIRKAAPKFGVEVNASIWRDLRHHGKR